MTPRNKTVAIEAHFLLSETGGNATYAEGLTNALIETNTDMNFLFLVSNPDAVEKFGLNTKGHRAVVMPSSRWLRVPFAVPLRCAVERPALLHSYSPITPPWTPCPFVVTVQDLMFETHPHLFTAAERGMFKFIRPTTRRARKIIAASEFTKQKLIELYNTPEKKITVVTHAAARDFSPAAEPRDAEARAKYGAREGCVLYVGRLNARKNLDVLIRAFAALPPGLRDAHPLVIAGKGGERERLGALACELGVDREVSFPGYVAREDLPALYRGAALFSYISEGEGFGLPALEALACGLPVLSTNVTSLPEVVGGAGILIAPGDTGAATEALRHLLENANADEFVRKALRQGAKFSWKTSAEKTIQVYMEFMN